MKLDGSVAWTWGSTPEERKMSFPCDAHLSDADDEYFRAVHVDAPADVVFRWLCQLKIAPYSYDLIDNLGRRSPRRLTPGTENLALGQKVMTIFEVVEFEKNRHLTVTLSDPRAKALFGQVTLSYVVLPITEDSCRLVAKLGVIHSRKIPRTLTHGTLPWGDLVMMRKQLLNLKNLSEDSFSTRA